MMFRRFDVLVIALSLGAFLSLFARVVPSGRFGYDESDYMYAVTRGFRANYLDEPTISIASFIDKGLQEFKGRTSSASLSEFIRDSGDINFYRHYHAPLSFYWAMANRLVLGDREGSIRWSAMVCMILVYIVIYLGCLLLGEGQGRVAAIVASSLFLLSPTNIMTAEHVGPHCVYVGFSIATLFAISLFLTTGNLLYFYGSALLLCLATLTLEYSPLLTATGIACLVIRRDVLASGRSGSEVSRHLVRAFLWFVLVFALLWPAGLFKLSILKNYTFFAYFALKRSHEYGTDPSYQVWWGRVLASPVEYFLMLGAITWFGLAFVRGRKASWALPFVIYAVLIFATTLRNKSTSPTYISSLLPPLHVLVGGAVAQWAGRPIGRQVGVAAVVILAAFASNYCNFLSSRLSGEASTPTDHLVDFYDDHRPGARRILVPMGLLPTLHYYFPQADLMPYRDAGGHGPGPEILDRTDAEEIVSAGDGGSGWEAEVLRRGWSRVAMWTPSGGQKALAIYSAGPSRRPSAGADGTSESPRP